MKALEEKEANELISKLVELRNNYNLTKSNKDLRELNKHKDLCAEKFKYIILSKTYKYKKYSNYNDLVQDGYVALSSAMNNFDPNKGSFFWWAHKYIGTKIARMANAHLLVRTSMKNAKQGKIPMFTDMINLVEKDNPEELNDLRQGISNIEKYFSPLDEMEKKVVSLYFGFNDLSGNESTDGRKVKISEISKNMNVTYLKTKKILNKALSKMKEQQ